MKRQIPIFVLRWLVSSTVMWFCITKFAEVGVPQNMWLFAMAGLIFSLLNAIVKPIVSILSLPFVIVTLGLFIFIINGSMVALTIWLLPGVKMGFWKAVLSSIVMSIVNALVNLMIPSYNRR